ncbi:triphosphoribosyl-dephospho-CoA synthase [Planctomycetes bacterium K23_9]|uniref:ATP:dephospho-CoA triphosphoribosyl transferase n=1 Tax=Stieleria marina TaxID=1930275 RepID=A0A517NX34_9BACT|nr:ATP:dephospho-CoA triphosphoribosyl transferase [Planctomycetes bacterium K23_9]
MTDALDDILGRSSSPSIAVLTACTLEASAPKAGNVHPGASFDDLSFTDFVAAARITGDAFADLESPVCQRTLRAASEIAETLHTNVNLGILLLLAPLVAADEQQEMKTLSDWQPVVAEQLKTFTPDDSQALLQTISVSTAGGLGTVDEMDVNAIATQNYDIVAAMRLAQSRDRIALQYASDFADFFDNVVPVVESSLTYCKDKLDGIAESHLRLLAFSPDTLISRKCGEEVANEVQRRAAEVDRHDPASIARFDDYLRSDSNRLNPGTTADLIAAALYVLLRTGSN